MQVHSQTPTSNPDEQDSLLQEDRNCQESEAVNSGVDSADKSHSLTFPALTNQEAEELGIRMELLGVEFRADDDCRLWPELDLFKSTRDF